MILGSYCSAQGGRIYLNLSGNMENCSLFGTVQHEAGHALLTETTLLGTLQNVMQMESMASEEHDVGYSKDRYTCALILAQKTRKVQEIYANNIELLTLEKVSGKEKMLSALRNKPQEYQKYYDEMLNVHQSKLSNQKKIECIHTICTYAMNLSIPQLAFEDYRALSAFLHDQNDPYIRLKQAIECFEEKGTVPVQALDVIEVLTFIERITHYIKPYIRTLITNLDDLLEKASHQSLNELINIHLMKRICLFDVTKIQPIRDQRLTIINNIDVFLVVKGVQNLLNEEHYYLVGYNHTYFSKEVDCSELDDCIENCVSGCILMSEYRKYQDLIAAFENHKRLLTVIFQTSEECAQWLEEEKKKGIVYAGEIQTACDQLAVSILFFCRRGCPQRIFVFPTLHAIRNCLIRDHDMESYCYQANEEPFLLLLSFLKDEVRMLSYIEGLVSLLLGRSNELLQKSDMFNQFVFKIERNLWEHVLRIKRDDYYSIMAALPQQGMCGTPLYTLMRFDRNINTGDIYLDASTKAPLLFLEKDTADSFASHWATEYTGVGVDQIFWPIFQSMVQSQNGTVIIVLDSISRLGISVSIDKVTALLYKS